MSHYSFNFYFPKLLMRLRKFSYVNHFAAIKFSGTWDIYLSYLSRKLLRNSAFNLKHANRLLGVSYMNTNIMSIGAWERNGPRFSHSVRKGDM